MKGVLDKSELDRLCRWYNEVLKHIPESKSKALKAAAEAVKVEVDRQIGQRVTDSHGKVRSWQGVTMGSEGGYSRVGPTTEPTTNKYGKHYGYNAAQVTSYIERGHGTPKPTGKDPDYRARLKTAILSGNGAAVPGRLFYSWAKMRASELGVAAAEEVLEKLADEFVDLLYELS